MMIIYTVIGDLDKERPRWLRALVYKDTTAL